MQVTKENLKQELDKFNKDQLKQVAEFMEFIKFRSQSHQTISATNDNDDDSKVDVVENFRQAWHEAMTGQTVSIASIFQEFAEEDRELAEAGMADYAEQLQQEDQS
jgi:uncharacterized glyoxalase superfamily metalloenzyme YdcJ